MLRQTIIRWVSYPLIMGLIITAMMASTELNLPYWPLIPLIALLGVSIVPLLERLQPYEVEWRHDHADTLTDGIHALVSLTLLFTAIEIVSALRTLLPQPLLWPDELPLWMDVLLGGAIIDFGMWVMHRLSHQQHWLWRLHAIHHSSQRLYWLNGERRHPLSALILSGPGILLTLLLGVPPLALGIWFSIVAVHLAFQHGNLDYRLGPARWLLGVAENHRWHHKREYEDAQVNFGEVWMIWDLLFGTFHREGKAVRAGDVGIHADMPDSYLAQLKWPLRKN